MTKARLIQTTDIVGQLQNEVKALKAEVTVLKLDKARLEYSKAVLESQNAGREVERLRVAITRAFWASDRRDLSHQLISAVRHLKDAEARVQEPDKALPASAPGISLCSIGALPKSILGLQGQMMNQMFRGQSQP